MDIQTVKTIAENFTKELEDAASGKKTSLPFIIHSLPSVSLVKDDKPFQVLVLGGSTGKKGVLKKSEGGYDFVEKEESPLPPFHTKQQVLDYIDQMLSDDVNTLALNFTYPLKPIFEESLYTKQKRLDGILISGGKENTFEGLIGEKIGQVVEKYFFDKYKRKLTVAVANDTICLLLSGLTQFKAEEIAAGIVGTGMNFAIFVNQTTAVNLEAANFDKFSPSDEVKIIDKSSAHSGKALFEKEIAGAYLYKHFNLIAKKRRLQFDELLSTSQLDDLVKNGDDIASTIAKGLFEKSASLVAAAVAGITMFNKRDMTFIMEGSLFWNETYKRFVEKYLEKLQLPYKVSFLLLINSSYFGAAKLVS